jgi:hypothetical protein
VLKDNVSLVTSYVLNVKELLLIVKDVPSEELKLQNVNALMDISLTNLSLVECVTLNVELVLLTMSVLNVPNYLIENSQKNVLVLLDISIKEFPNVENVTINVLLVLNSKFVNLHVSVKESMLHNVDAQIPTMKLVIPNHVFLVTQLVTDVLKTLLIV